MPAGISAKICAHENIPLYGTLNLKVGSNLSVKYATTALNCTPALYSGKGFDWSNFLDISTCAKIAMQENTGLFAVWEKFARLRKTAKKF